MKDGPAAGRAFLKTGSILAADTYTVTLKSGSDAFTSVRGALDGNWDGTAGENYVAVFSVNPPTQIRLGLPDFMRGPGQAVDVPAANFAGLPLSLTSNGDVRSLRLEIRYDPRLLLITDAKAGSGLPVGAGLQVDLSQIGLVRITIESASALAAGKVTAVVLTAFVPVDAPYQAKHRIDISAVRINGNLVECADDDALHVVGYIGDTNASQKYEKDDVSLILRAALKMDSGFAAWDDVSPLIVADIDGNSALTATDGTRVSQEMSGVNRAEIPDIPTADGKLQVAASLAAWIDAHGGLPSGQQESGLNAHDEEGSGSGHILLTPVTRPPSFPTVTFNKGLLNFGVGGPVNQNSWLVSWVAGSAKPANKDWKVVLT